jgi:hypothetical protein
VLPLTFLSLLPVLHSFAGRPIDHPGIFEGLDSPPTIFHASLVFIIISPLLSYYHLIVSELRPAGACCLVLEAWRLVLGALNPVSLQSFNHLKNSSQLRR